MENETIIMELIMNGGDARAFSLRAIQEAECGNYEEAEQLLQSANESLNKAHDAQTKMIQEEVRGNASPPSMLMIHAQDHVMNAMTVKDLAIHIIQNQREVQQLKKMLKEEVK